MILHWDQLPLHYGPELHAYRQQFETAGQTTYGVLCCRFTPVDDHLGSSGGAHAEAKLLQSDVWQVHIRRALQEWTPLADPIVVTMALNRSPCRDCASLLIKALSALHLDLPVACDQSRFILASRGAYEDATMSASTTQNDLIRLRDAGWELCVLQTGTELSARGRILLAGLERLVGTGFVLLAP